MLVLDGVVKELNIEPEPGKADLSSAEHLLGQIIRQNAGAWGQPDVEEDVVMSHSLSFFFAVALSSTASPAFAQTQPQRAAMALGVAQSGVVRAIDVVDGALVEAGQVLVELDCEPLRMEIDVRAASLAAANAVYERVVNGPRPEEISIGEAGVGVALARAEEARAALDRAHGLEVGISITLAQLLVAERDSRIADAVLVDARKKLALLKVGSRFEDIAEAKARRDSAAAFLDEGKADLDQCSVRAPAAGTIKVLVTLGQLVSTYAPTTLVQLTPDAEVKAAAGA